MSVGKAQRNSGGREPRNDDGRTPRNVASGSTGCCCGLSCPFCDAPTPQVYEIAYSGITRCAGATPNPNRTYTNMALSLGTTGAPPVVNQCTWIDGDADFISYMSTIGTGMQVELEPNGFSGLRYFQLSPLATYGPDCSVPLTVNNRWTSAASCGGLVLGYGGTATATPVLPP